LPTSTEQSPAKQGHRKGQRSLENRRAFTITEWCARFGYSRPHFYALRKLGQSPDVIGTGKGTRVTLEAEQLWLKRQERLAKKSNDNV
jgi:predicted DNA-binding transcriptional regulator AlpA